MFARKFVYRFFSLLLILSFALGGSFQAGAQGSPQNGGNPPHVKKGKITLADRINAAKNKQAQMQAAGVTSTTQAVVTNAAGQMVPDYYGSPNFALSPLPSSAAAVVNFSGGGGANAAASATVSNGVVTGLTLTAGGSGYTAAPGVSITGGTGSGASATAGITTDTVSAVNLLTGGSGYTAATVNFGGPGTGASALATVTTDTVSSLTLLAGGSGYTAATVGFGGPGTGASASATVTTDTVSSIAVLTPGSGYLASDAVNFSGPGTGASASLAVDGTGAITAITVLTGGTGFTSAPTVSINTATGTGATFNVVVTGAVTGLTLLTGGTGFTSAPQVNILGDGTGASASAAVTGAVTGLTLTTGGTSFTSAPLVNIVGDGTGASADAVVSGSVTSLTLLSGGSGYFAGGILKFADGLPGLGPTNANNLGVYLPIASPDTTTYPGSDYYEIELNDYTQQFNSSLQPTTLRGYRQVNNGGTPFTYLGPIIVAQKDRPVRVKFINSLPTGTGGNLFVPFDSSIMGAGLGPDMVTNYTQNRATLHLHGGNTPWISDGTAQQWITPANENTPYPEGVSVENVPDMAQAGCNSPTDGCQTFFYTNEQSARLLFYHDHAYGITRLNVYSGEAAGYVITDSSEQAMITNGILPDVGIPLIIQDKSFIDPANVLNLDPTWPFPVNSAHNDLWYPHVYMPNQNPYDISGALAMGRWDYGPWFWPPFTGIQNGILPNPYCLPTPGVDCSATPWEAPFMPGTPSVSLVPEAFTDTPVVNGTAYPTLTVNPGLVRFRILNAANDRYWNLSLFRASGPGAGIVGSISITNPGSGYLEAPAVTISPAAGDTTGRGAIANATIDPLTGAVTDIAMNVTGSSYSLTPVVTIAAPPAGGTQATAVANLYTGDTEVGMIPFNSNYSFPASWQTTGNPFILDDRVGGVPDPATRGPAMIQIGTESGFLPAPAVIGNQPVSYDYNRRSITVLNILQHALFLGPAERADVVVDFSQFAGKTLILFNDSPAPVPAGDPRNDYFTGDPDQTAMGGAPVTQPGYGPNTRTIMQIKVTGSGGSAPVDYVNSTYLANLTAAVGNAFATMQHKPIVPNALFNSIYGANYPADSYARIQDTALSVQGDAVTGLTLTNGGGGYTSAPQVFFNGGGGNGAAATATLGPAAVSSLTLTNAGSGFTSAPTISFSGGGGSNAAATAALAAKGSVKSVTVTSGGSKYTTAPTVTFAAPPAPGVTATGTAVISKNRVTAINITNPGSGYLTAPAINITGGGGSGAAATATLGFTVASITLTNGGSGYTSAPIVAFNGGGGINAAATATLAPRVVASLTLTSGGSGYTSAPLVSFQGGGGSNTSAVAVVGKVSLDLQPKTIQELFEPVYGRMNALLGVEIPNTTMINQTTIPYSDIDPPTDIVLNTKPGTAIGSLGNGVQIWKITHNGVDTHAIHFHMFDVQLVNRVGWDGMIKPPEPNEVGWKDTIRMNPLEDIIIAIRPIVPTLPFGLPNSIRPLDPTMPVGPDANIGSLTAGLVDVQNNPVTVDNQMINYGYEYMWHCHLLDHEENIMMRYILVTDYPKAPSNVVATLTGTGNSQGAALTWVDNSTNETGWIIQQATSATGPWTTVGTINIPLVKDAGFSTGGTNTFNVAGLTKGGVTYYFQVLATNVTGLTQTFAAPAVGFPTMTANSDPGLSNSIKTK